MFFNLRTATFEDKEFVHNLFKKYMKDFFDNYTQEGWNDEKFYRSFRQERITIFEKDTTLAGFLDAEPVFCQISFLYLRGLCVDERYRGHAYDLDQIIDEKALNYSLKILRGKIFNANKRSLRFFQLMGYKVIGEIPKESSVWVEKVLAE